jgi:lipopolysaccharide biosynthesis glycosyltransferase
MKKVVPIAFAFDENLVMPACVCITSLLMNASDDTFYDIFILYQQSAKFDIDEIDQLQNEFENCRITYRKISGFFDHAFEIRGITTPAYYRLLIPELVPEYDKIIYSDVDVIFRHDLYDVYCTDLSGYYVAGVDSLANLQPEVAQYYRNRLGLSPTGIIYSGNIILNSKELRDNDVLTEFKALAKNEYLFQDMDVINIVCRGKIKYLPPFFCLTTYISEFSIYKRDELLKIWSEADLNIAREIGIVHFNGKKPWKDVCINFDVWWEYYRRSPFYDAKKYFDFFNQKLHELDTLPFKKRLKLLLRYFIFNR